MNLRGIIDDNRREVTDVLYLVALQGVNFIAPLVVLPYLMKTLGAAGFGCIGFSLAVCQYLQLIVDFGFNLSATKRVSLSLPDQGEVNRVFSAVFYAKMALLAVSAVLLLAVSLLPAFAVYRPTLYIMFLTVVGNAFLFVFLFQGIGQVRWVSIANAVAKFAVLPLTFLLVKGPGDCLVAAAVQASVSLVAALITVSLTAARGWARLLRPVWADVRAALRDSWPLFLSSAATNVYTACFIVILGLFASPDEVGRYSAVDRVMRALCYAALLPVLQAFYPKVCRMACSDRAGAWRLGGQLLVFELLAMTAVGASLFFGGAWVEAWLKGDYAGTASLFRLDALVPLFVGAGGVTGQLMVLALGGERQRVWFKRVYYLAAAVALAGVLALTPVWGAMGTVAALLATECTVAVGFAVCARRMRKEERRD